MSLPGEEAGPGRLRGTIVLVCVGILAVAGALWLRGLRLPDRPSPESPRQRIDLESPRGEVLRPPDLFRWRPVPGAVRYTVRIFDEDAVWPIFVRITASPALSLEPSESSALHARRIHVWEVEAFDGEGNLIATAGARFKIRAPDLSAP